MYKRLFPSVEHIKQQSGDFFKDLVKTIDSIKAEGLRAAKWGKEEADKIAKVVSKHVNANVTVVFDYYDAFLMEEYWETFYDKTKKENMVVDGALDYATGKLKGDFAKLKVKLFSSFDIFQDPFSTEEAAAVILHECGHMATMMDLTARLLLSNFAIRDLAEKYNESMNLEERRSVITTTTKNLKLKKEQIEEAAKGKDLASITFSIAKGFSEGFKSELGCDPYDYTSSEFLADQYATKQGAGRYLITGLDKFGIRKRNVILQSVQEIISIGMFTALGVGGIVLASPFAAVFWFSIALIAITNGRPTEMELRYNRPEERLTRIRLQMVARLNDKKLPKEIQEQTRKDIKVIDESIKFAKDNHSLLEKLSYVLFSNLRKRVSAQELQMQLEKLALNDLFLKAYDLKQIA